ncbi:pry1p [Saccharomyces arboricola H-6]|uniref:Pry1p n=1 Tax=Saccharomyces arboricola (strain H-6 / AS 2.3317 / CBS 10644) TaxID=1160507 RepID=J8LM62_SACAR|nr:pry1p [Saccharomyces arboricola H-6]
MKLSKLSILTSALATTAFAAPAVVTVTEHAHNAAVVTVQGVVYVENGQTFTTYETLSPAATANPTSTATAVVAPPVVATSSSSDYNKILSVLQNLAKASSKTAATSSTTTLTPSTSSSPSQRQATTTSAQATTTTSQAAAATTSASSDENLSDFASNILAEHNKKRALHKDTPALAWSSTLATYAQDYADNYDCSGTLTHSGGEYGENLALGYDGPAAVDAWYNEISDYDFSNPGFSSNTGHFTQVVWKSSTQVGCGIKTCGGEWGDYVICSYNPAGNYEGEYADNVEPLA